MSGLKRTTPTVPQLSTKLSTVIMREKAPVREMAPVGEMVPIGEMAPGWAKKYKEEIFLKNVRTRCHLTRDYGMSSANQSRRPPTN